MELIEREQLKATIRKMVELPNEDRAKVIGAINREKAIDIVRCKDCKHRGDAEECPMRYFETERSYDVDGHMMLDYFDHDYSKDDGFCDRGERKVEDV